MVLVVVSVHVQSSAWLLSQQDRRPPLGLSLIKNLTLQLPDVQAQRVLCLHLFRHRDKRQL
jgi:hypothetical protein